MLLGRVAELLGIAVGDCRQLDEVLTVILGDACTPGEKRGERDQLWRLEERLQKVLRQVSSGDDSTPETIALQERLEKVMRQVFSGGDCTSGGSRGHQMFQ